MEVWGSSPYVPTILFNTLGPCWPLEERGGSDLTPSPLPFLRPAVGA